MQQLNCRLEQAHRDRQEKNVQSQVQSKHQCESWIDRPAMVTVIHRQLCLQTYAMQSEVVKAQVVILVHDWCGAVCIIIDPVNITVLQKQWLPTGMYSQCGLCVVGQMCVVFLCTYASKCC